MDNDRVTSTLPQDDILLEEVKNDYDKRVTSMLPQDDIKPEVNESAYDHRITGIAAPDDVIPQNNDEEIATNQKRRVQSDQDKKREESIFNKLTTDRDEYTVISKLSDGGQATVYRVKDLKNVSYIAKVYHKGHENKNKEAVIDLLYKKKTPGLVEIIDHGVINGQSFYIMKELQSLINLRGKEFFNDVRINRFIKILNEAVHTIHLAGLIHTDIKTENIMYDIEKDIPVIIDFGSVSKGELGRFNEGELSSVTTSDFRISEGYSPPEFYGLAGTKKKYIVVDGKTKLNPEYSEMVITPASDYFQLGICWSEIFSDPCEDKKVPIKVSRADYEEKYKDVVIEEDSSDLFEGTDEIIIKVKTYRLFLNNNSSYIKVSQRNVGLQDSIANNQRLNNLIRALLQYDAKDRATYEDINQWLSGKLIKIKDKFPLNHYFCGQYYDDTEKLSVALVQNWAEAQKDILRGQLEKDFEECKDKKRYIEIQNIRLEFIKSEKKDTDLDIMTFKSICIVNPEICLFWKGKTYPIKNKMNLEFAKDICGSIDKKDNKFLDLFRYGLIKYFYETKGLYDSVNETEKIKKYRATIDKITEIGKSQPEIAALLFADAQTPGMLKARITGGKKEFEEYFSDYNSEFEKNGFDKIIEYYLGAHGQRTSLCELLEKISVHKEYNAYFLKMNLNSIQYTKEDLYTDRLFGIVIAVFNNIQKLIKKDSLIDTILNSATYIYMNSYIESYNFFNFIDNGGIEAESIKSDFKAVSNENKKIIGELSDAKHLVGFFVPSYCAISRIDIRGTSDCMFIFEKSITGSGLKIPYSSYIVPTSERGELYLINDNYLATKHVVDSLLNANYKFKYKALKDREKVYEYVVDKNYKVIDSFLTNFVWKTGIKPEECLDNWGIASIYLELFLIILLYLLICAAGVVLVRTVIHAFRDGIKYLFLYRAITLIISICCINKAINYINNDGRVVVANIKNHLASKKLMYHYDLIISAVNEIGGRQKNRKTSPIGHNTFELLECACATNNNVQNAEKYISDNNIMGYLGGYYDVRRLGMIKSIVASSIILLYLLLPVNSLNEYLIAYNYNGAHTTVDKMQDSKLMYYASKPFAMATLKMTEKRCVNNIYDAFNKDNKYSLSEVIQQNNDYKSLFRIIGIPLNKSNDEKLDKMQDSKIAYEAYVLNGSMVSSIEELRELYKVIPDDHNYTTAQNAINDYMYSTNIMLQRGIDNNDDYAIEMVKAKYREIMSEPGTYGDLPIILNILDTYQGEERAVRLVSHQLSKLVNDVCRPSYQLYRVGAVKKRNGLYFAKLVFDNSHTNWLISSYKNRFFAINTYSYFDSSYKESEEYPDRAYDLIGIDDVKDSFDMTSADPKTWTDGMFFNVINSANEYIPNEENY